ncbi:MAG: hypothetical protein ACRDG8_09550 [Actinomycetota bacterium]
MSLFVPTHRSGPGVKQDRIRWRKLLAETEKTLRGEDARRTEAEDLLRPARELLDDALFWQYQSDGLAMFIGAGWSRFFRVAIPLPELGTVGRRFVVGPLLPLLADGGRYFVLALSQNEIRLLEGTRFGLEEVELQDPPRSLRAMLAREEQRPEVHGFLADRGGVGSRVVFYGQGGGADVGRKEQIVRYFRKVDRVLRSVIKDDRAPVVLAGVEYLLPLYRRASELPHLLRRGVRGSPEELSPHELHGRAWRLAEPVFRRREREAAARYRRLLGTGLTVNDPEAALEASRASRIEALFLSSSTTTWETHASSPVVRLEEAAPEPTWQVLDLLAITTLRRGGDVYAVPDDRVPDRTGVAGVLRF